MFRLRFKNVSTQTIFTNFKNVAKQFLKSGGKVKNKTLVKHY